MHRTSSSSIAPDTWRYFWAKTDPEDPEGRPPRPLWAHLLDVATVALFFWRKRLPQVLKRQIAGEIELPEDEAARWFSLLIGLHDTGKAIPFFQGLHPPSKACLQAKGLSFESSAPPLHHGHASIAILKHYFHGLGNFPEMPVALVGFHHGKLAPRKTWKGSPEAIGDTCWQEAQCELINRVKTCWVGDTPWPSHLLRMPWRAWGLPFAGWVTLSDWLGSMAECFPEVHPRDNLQTYREQIAEAVSCSFTTSGLIFRAAFRPFKHFRDHFDFEPRPLQRLAADLPLEETPTLFLFEAPTGEGKTEAAFHLAARLHQETPLQEGIYIAMPTQATSNQLFERLAEFLENAHDTRCGPANIRLVHGNDILQEAQLKLVSNPRTWLSIFDSEASETRGVTTLGWFMPRKRGLLAPYGVGTVDQAFLAVLFARHFFLRLFGLCGKVVIFDEVHAYDTYMNKILRHLLRWLKETQAHVILLSATLPESTRKEIISSWTSEDESCTGAPYPVCWKVTASSIEKWPFQSVNHRRAYVQWTSPAPENVARRAREALQAGAFTGIILNSVRRAQEVYQKLKDLIDRNVYILHARFPYDVRQEKERAVMKRFGKSRPSEPAILVATQVVEQSLDLDFDYLITDLAPIDLLFQRMGRLHRHSRSDRPEGFARPSVCILCEEPSGEGALPDVQRIGGGTIYSEAVLWFTWLAIQDRRVFRFPQDYRPLIETVYTSYYQPVWQHVELSEQEREKLQRAIQKDKDAFRGASREASQRLIPEPDNLEELLELTYPELAEEDEGSPELHKDFRALTRLTDLSVEALCLFQDAGGELYLDDGFKTPVETPAEPNTRALQALLSRNIRLTHPGIINDLLHRTDRPAAWEELQNRYALLKHYIPLTFNHQRQMPLKTYVLHLDRDIGLYWTKHPTS